MLEMMSRLKCQCETFGILICSTGARVYHMTEVDKVKFVRGQTYKSVDGKNCAWERMKDHLANTSQIIQEDK